MPNAELIHGLDAGPFQYEKRPGKGVLVDRCRAIQPKIDVNDDVAVVIDRQRGLTEFGSQI